MTTDLVESRGTNIEALRAPAQVGGAMVNAEAERAVAEVQSALVIAKRFPRNEDASFDRIIKACTRPSLAEIAQYAYTKGGTDISGPSIDLAKVLAQAWGNITYGWRELQRFDEYSEVEAYCWDLETNTKTPLQFVVRHEYKASGKIKQLTDPREIYENMANQAARRLRACILSIIPPDVVDKAVERCERTLKEGSKAPLSDRIRDMLANFASEFNVTRDMIEKRLGKKAEAVTETELVGLRKIFKSLKDNMVKVEEFFDATAAAQQGTSSEDLKKPKEPAAPPASTGADKPTSSPERPVSPAPAAGSGKPITEPPKTMRVANRAGVILQEILFVPEVGSVLDIGGFPYRVIEVTDHVLVKPGEMPEKRPEEKKTTPAEGEATTLELQTVINEVMSAETTDDIKEADALIDKLPEKDRAAARAMLRSKEAQLKGGKTRKRGGSLD